MSLVQINWKPNARDLRMFGATIVAGFAVIGAIVFFRGAERAAYACWVGGGLAGALGLTGSRAALPVYLAWMGVAFVLGSVMTRVVLVLVYYGVVTPLGIASRLAGRDRLQLSRPGGESYWLDLSPPSDKDDYERQF